jgi:hypothetical protein
MIIQQVLAEAGSSISHELFSRSSFSLEKARRLGDPEITRELHRL